MIQLLFLIACYALFFRLMLSKKKQQTLAWFTALLLILVQK
ncbi:hypothetical protein Sez_0449 [Streptococcus equi subsp. zooepidemicus MGCS10565]|uniref:Uncharacterized protein n=1 Tax=Streptococcus equi subsp. zooepidemicus (strain MGCS10565) TaxID=552526 RepID=B4U1F4_STREM|nr:hypothetical protein Sez_0449 [Streptococcus equi subsp. zooepidemicus MGCS10565]